jgi:uncharacterized membrane protein SirB2
MVPFWTWFQEIPIIDKIGDTGYLYNTFSVLHYFCVFVTVGSMALVDLRVMGVAAKRVTLAQLADQIFPWMWTALVIATVSGFLEFAPTGASFAPDHIFQTKLVLIVLAVVFGVIVQRNVRKWSQMPAIPAGAKILALISLLLWLGAILAALDVAAISGLG